MSTPNTPAFPIIAPDHGPIHAGMSLRDWFAGQALVGIISARMDETHDDAAYQAYRYADAMLAEREQQ